MQILAQSHFLVSYYLDTFARRYIISYKGELVEIYHYGKGERLMLSTNKICKTNGRVMVPVVKAVSRKNIFGEQLLVCVNE